MIIQTVIFNANKHGALLVDFLENIINFLNQNCIRAFIYTVDYVTFLIDRCFSFF
jgi:hypothetical protein